jgi:toxin ParE1/3/4
MSLALTVSPGAESDILEAFDWYEQRQEGLGRRFIGELDSTFSRILEDPLAYREDLPGIRRSLLHVFPYLVFYTLRGVIRLRLWRCSMHLKIRPISSNGLTPNKAMKRTSRRRPSLIAALGEGYTLSCNL